jgi:hypothetical protein
MNRGPRCGGEVDPDDPTKSSPPLGKLSPGNTFIFFVNAITFSGSGYFPTLPEDTKWIPAFSIVELLISPRNMDSVVNGRIINVKSMRVSINQYDGLFQNGVASLGLPSTAEDGQRISTECKELYPAMSKDLEAEKTCFVVDGKKLTTCYMGEVPEVEVDRGPDTDMAALANPPQHIKIVVGNNSSFLQSEYVDVKIELIMKQTNTISTEHGCALLDVAFALGAVHLIVSYDARWSRSGSCYRAVPIIDTTILFASLKNVRSIEDGFATVAVCDVNGNPQTDDESGVEITKRVKLEKEDDDDPEDSAQILSVLTDKVFEDGVLELKVKVVHEDTSKSRGFHQDPMNNALSISGLGINCSKAYPFAFGVVCKNSEHSTPGIVQAFMSRGVQVSGLNRKRKAVKMSL